MPQPAVPLPNWFADVKRIFSNRGVGIDEWLPILFAESQGSPTAHNRGTAQNPEDSVGLFQLNRKGGQGAGYSVEQLMDPRVNAEIASRYIAEGKRLCQGRGDTSISCIAVNSGHPGMVPVTDKRVVWIAALQAALKVGTTDPDKWALGKQRAGEPPPSGGDSWFPSFPTGADFVSSAWDGLAKRIGQYLEAIGFIIDPRNLAYTVTLGFVAVTLIVIGLIGLALGGGRGEKAANVVALIPTPQAKGAAGAVRAVTRVV